jgi:hypothetical protein
VKEKAGSVSQADVQNQQHLPVGAHRIIEKQGDVHKVAVSRKHGIGLKFISSR